MLVTESRILQYDFDAASDFMNELPALACTLDEVNENKVSELIITIDDDDTIIFFHISCKYYVSSDCYQYDFSGHIHKKSSDADISLTDREYVNTLPELIGYLANVVYNFS